MRVRVRVVVYSTASYASAPECPFIGGDISPVSGLYILTHLSFEPEAIRQDSDSISDSDSGPEPKPEPPILPSTSVQ